MNEQDSNLIQKLARPIKNLRVRRQKPKTWSKPGLVISHAPHILSESSVSKTMWMVSLALVPACIWGILRYTFNLKINLFGAEPFITYEKISSNFFLIDILINNSFLTILVAILSCVITEAIIQFCQGKKIRIADGSAFLTGLLLGMSLPAKRPFLIIIISSMFTLIFIKHLFGGIGQNFMNPAIAGRLFAMVNWPALLYRQEVYSYSDTELESSIYSFNKLDGLTGATPLALIKQIQSHSDVQSILQQSNETLAPIASNWSSITPIKTEIENYLSQSIPNLIIGNTSGCIGELSSILLLLGGFYLIWKKYITHVMPMTYLSTVLLLCFISRAPFGEFNLSYSLYHLFSGSLIFGAFFIATDPVSSPITQRGQMVMGIFLGSLTYTIRIYGGYPEGVAFAILIGNFLNPFVDKIFVPRIYGHRKYQFWKQLFKRIQRYLSKKYRIDDKTASWVEASHERMP